MNETNIRNGIQLNSCETSENNTLHMGEFDPSQHSNESPWRSHITNNIVSTINSSTLNKVNLQKKLDYCQYLFWDKCLRCKIWVENGKFNTFSLQLLIMLRYFAKLWTWLERICPCLNTVTVPYTATILIHMSCRFFKTCPNLCKIQPDCKNLQKLHWPYSDVISM